MRNEIEAPVREQVLGKDTFILKQINSLEREKGREILFRFFSEKKSSLLTGTSLKTWFLLDKNSEFKNLWMLRFSRLVWEAKTINGEYFQEEDLSVYEMFSLKF